jgi:hypothetical protein
VRKTEYYKQDKIEELLLGANDALTERHVARENILQLHHPTLKREDVKTNAGLEIRNSTSHEKYRPGRPAAEAFRVRKDCERW